MLSKISLILSESNLHHPVNKEYHNPTKMLKALVSLTYHFAENRYDLSKTNSRTKTYNRASPNESTGTVFCKKRNPPSPPTKVGCKRVKRRRHYQK